MGNTTGISWTHRTMNPIRVKYSRTFYCIKVSPACNNCYAEKMAKRLAGMGGTQFYPYKHLQNPPELELNREMLESWKRTKKPYLNFVTSMTDLFGEFVPKEWIFEILDAMVASPLQVFQCLTKRAKWMRQVVDEYCESRQLEKLPQNIWCGITVESQKYYDQRAEDLMRTKASIRWLSMEPLLGPVNLHFTGTVPADWGYGYKCVGQLIHWVVAGGETGSKLEARPTHPEWFRSIQRQCADTYVPFFFKQFGNYYPCAHTERNGHIRYFYPMCKDGADMPRSIVDTEPVAALFPFEECQHMKYMPKKQAGELLDGVAYRQFPAIDHPAIPED